MKEAHNYLIEKRPQIWPNDGFMLQLIRYENELIKSREIVPTVGKDEVFLSSMNNPIETLEELEKRSEK